MKWYGYIGLAMIVSFFAFANYVWVQMYGWKMLLLAWGTLAAIVLAITLLYTSIESKK